MKERQRAAGWVLFGVLCLAPAGAEPGQPPLVPAPDLEGMQPAVVDRITEVRREVMEHPDWPGPWSRLGAVCDAHELFACADAAYARAHELAPKDFRWLYLRGVVFMRTGGEPSETVALFKRAIELAPEYAPARARLGLALARQGKYHEAVEEHQQAIRLNPDLAIAHRALGQALLTLGQVDEAVQALERAARLERSDATIFNTLARAYARAGRRERARQTAEVARRLRPIDSIPDPVRAAVLSEAVNLAALEKRAANQMTQREYENAIATLELIDELRPEDPYVLRLLGRAYRMRGRVGQAERCLKAALRAKPDMVEVRMGLASLLAEQQRFDEVIHQYRLLLEYAPDHGPVRLRLASLLLQEGRFAEAAEQYQLAEKRLGLDDADRMLWGEALLGAGKLDDAVEKLRAVTKADPQNAEAHFLLARAYQRLGEKENADAHFRRAIRIQRGPAGDRD